MANVILWFLDSPLGPRVLANVNAAFRAEYVEHPDIKNISVFLTNRGWPCTFAEDTFIDSTGKLRSCYGLKFEDKETLTAFVLKWG